MQFTGQKERLLVIDEVQKIHNWSEFVKKQWDEDTWNNTHIKLQIKATIAPRRIVVGMINRKSSVRNNRRDRCGTAKPIKAIGPQKAVDKAAITPVSNKIIVRKRFMFTPKFSAYRLPIIIMFKGFTSRDDAAIHTIDKIA